MKVLIADDVPENLYLLESLLKGHGYEVVSAVNGKDALEKLKQESVSLIISDILMPTMDGFQLCRAVKADETLRNIPLIFYTATYTTEKDRDFALSLGASRFILKPMDPEQFNTVITEVLLENKTGRLETGTTSLDQETEYLREHQARLIAKLEHKIAELERSDERYRSFVACAEDAIITLDTSGVMTSWNHAAERIFGYPADEALGKTFSFLAPDVAGGKPDVLVTKQKEERLIGVYETVRQTKSGVLVPVEISLSLMKDKQGAKLGTSAIVRDLTERKNTEQLMRTVFRSMGEGLAVIDRNFRIVFANDAYANRTRLSPDNARGMACHDVSRRHSRACSEDGFECPVAVTFRTGGPSSAVHRLDGVDTESAVLEVRSYPVKDHAGRIASAVEIVRDVTDRVRLEAQLLQSQKMEAIGRLASGVAHDFNNILTAIIGFGSLALGKVKPGEPLRADLNSILESANRASALTHSLLAFSRKQVMHHRVVDVNEIIGRVERFLRRTIGEDIELKTVLHPKALPVNADSGQIEQVLMNLATNARDAMPGGGAFSILTETMQADDAFISACGGRCAPGAYALITAADSGTGMDEATQKRIFEPFFTTKEEGRGTGLGLSIIYGIVQQHNGFISVSSEPGHGSVFKIYLPLTGEAIMDMPEPPLRAAVTSGTETVLIAEDDANVRTLSRDVLVECGCTVITAENGEEAIRKFADHPDGIHLVILDAIMPGKTGGEVFETIRKTQSRVKALFVSGYTADAAHLQPLLAKGADFIQKPVAPMVLLAKVREVLDRA
jgi:two-component system, cell cycle sensor histidine kinase and response regulator CckA